MDLTGKKYTDQTGRFPVTSSKGNKYILAAYHYDSNTIHAEPLKTISGLDLTTALQKTPQLIDQQRLETAPKYRGQQMPQCSQNFHEGGQRKISVSPAPHTYEKLSRTGHLNLQGAFHSQTI